MIILHLSRYEFLHFFIQAIEIEIISSVAFVLYNDGW